MERMPNWRPMRPVVSSRAVKVSLCALKKAFTVAADSRKSTASMTKLRSFKLRWSFSKTGISILQSLHQVVQKLRKTILPLKSEIRTVRPFKSFKAKSEGGAMPAMGITPNFLKSRSVFASLLRGVTTVDEAAANHPENQTIKEPASRRIMDGIVKRMLGLIGNKISQRKAIQKGHKSLKASQGVGEDQQTHGHQNQAGSFFDDTQMAFDALEEFKEMPHTQGC